MKKYDTQWIALCVDIFSDDKISEIEVMPKVGETIVNCWLRLLCMAGKINDDGWVYMTPSIPYTDITLARKWGKDIEIVQMALRVFSEYGMISISADKKIFITNFATYQEPLIKLREKKEKHRLYMADAREKGKYLPSKEPVYIAKTETKTIQGQENVHSEFTVSSQETQERSKTITQTGLSQSVENILREKGYRKNTIKYLGDNLNRLKNWMDCKSFETGKTIHDLCEACAEVYEISGDLPFDEIDAVIKAWPQIVKTLPKEKQSVCSKSGLSKWIKNKTWTTCGGVNVPTTTWTEKLSTLYPNLSVQLITDFPGESPEFYKTLETNQDEILRISQERGLPKHEFRSLVLERIK